MSKDSTGERLMAIETTLEYLKENQDKQGKMLTEFIKTADERYANKTVEKVVYALVGIIVVSVIVAILSKVII